MKHLLIDGNNLGIRSAFANSGLTSSDGTPTGMHYGFLKSIISLRDKFNDHKILVAWDSKSKRRISETSSFFEQGKIPSIYKANRKKDEIPEPLKNFYEQSIFLKKGIDTLGIPQIKIDGYEADDIIASYVYKLKDISEEIVILTSDEDYYQLISENVVIYDGMKNIFINQEYLKNLYGVNPVEFLHGCAIMGDDGDNIFGVPGWGEKTSMKEIKTHSTYENLINHYDGQFKNVREQHKDLNQVSDGIEKFAELQQEKFENGRPKYPNIYFDMPYSGVLYALSKNLIKASKSIIMLLCFQEIVKLAYSLKKMDIVDVPEIPILPKNEGKFIEYLEYYEMNSLVGAFDNFEA